MLESANHADTRLETALLRALLSFSYYPDTCAQLVHWSGTLPLLAALLQRHGGSACIRGLGSTGGDGSGSTGSHGPESEGTDALMPFVLELLWNLVELAPSAVRDALEEGCSSRVNNYHEIGGSRQTTDTASEELPVGVLPCDSSSMLSRNGGSVAEELTSTLGAHFVRLLSCADNRQAKELRNDALAALQHLLALRPCAAAALKSGLLGALLAAAAAPEAPQLCQTAAPTCGGGVATGVGAGLFTFCRDELDVELKLMLWCALAAAAEADPGCLAVITSRGGDTDSGSSSSSGGRGGGGFLALLLLHAEPGPTAAPTAEYTARLAPEQRAALRRAAWSALLRVAPLAKGAFLGGSCGGAAALVRCLDACAAAAAAPEHVRAATGQAWGSMARGTSGNSSGSGGAGLSGFWCESRELPARLVTNVCQGDGAGEAAIALANRGALGALLRLLQACSGGGGGGGVTAAAARAPEGARQATLLALSALCEAGGAVCRKLLRSCKGVAVLVEELQG
jgi:hypothetical protein